MPINIQSTADIAAKYARVTPQRESDYKDGVTNTAVDWAGPTQAAAPAYADGVQTAVTNGTFAKGVAEAGTAKWRRKTTDVGVARWGAGVRSGTPDYQVGVGPYRDTIANLSLEPRYKRGDPRNYVRVQQVGDALHAKKVSG